MEPLVQLLNKGRLLTLSANVRVVQKWLKMTNTLAYYAAVTKINTVDLLIKLACFVKKGK